MIFMENRACIHFTNYASLNFRLKPLAALSAGELQERNIFFVVHLLKV